MELNRPPSVDDLYFDRGGPVEPWRPIMPGDVFSGIVIPEAELHEFVMVVTHPCSMRGRHGALVPRLQIVAVRPGQSVPLSQWITGHFRVMPLPDLIAGSDVAHVAHLNEIGLVRSDQLNLVNRVACLSDLGLLLLQQRFIANLARVAVKLETLECAASGVLAEAELLEEWLAQLAQQRVAAGEPQDVALADETQAFDEYLSAGPEPDLRAQLNQAANRASVRRSVRAEIQRRSEPGSDS